MADKVSITICGDGGCGKSSITLRLVRSEWTHEYDPTIEDSYSVTRTVDGLPYFLSLTDTAGQEEYRGLWASQNLKSDAFLLVYDITNANTLETLEHFMEMIDIEADQRVEDGQRLRKQELAARPAGGGQNGLSPGDDDDDFVVVGMPPPVKIIAGNKCDLRDARAVSSRQGLEFSRKNGCGFMETSAREMVNIEETFALIIRRVVEARRLHYRQQKEQYAKQHQSSYLSTGNLSLYPSSSADRQRHASSSSSPYARSKTAALTALERGPDDTSNKANKDASPKRQSRWLSVGRAMIGSRRSSNRLNLEALPRSADDDKTTDGGNSGIHSSPATAGGGGAGVDDDEARVRERERETDQRGRSRSRSRWRRACCRS